MLFFRRAIIKYKQNAINQHNGFHPLVSLRITGRKVKLCHGFFEVPWKVSPRHLSPSSPLFFPKTKNRSNLNGMHIWQLAGCKAANAGGVGIVLRPLNKSRDYTAGWVSGFFITIGSCLICLHWHFLSHYYPNQAHFHNDIPWPFFIATWNVALKGPGIFHETQQDIDSQRDYLPIESRGLLLTLHFFFSVDLQTFPHQADQGCLHTYHSRLLYSVKQKIKSRYGKKEPETEMNAEISSGFMLVMIRLTKPQNHGSIPTRLKTQLSLSLKRLFIISNSSLIWRLESFLKKFGRHLNTVTCSEPGTWRTADSRTRNLGKCPALKPLKVVANAASKWSWKTRFNLIMLSLLTQDNP